jgi:hypothetical protein
LPGRGQPAPHQVGQLGVLRAAEVARPAAGPAGREVDERCGHLGCGHRRRPHGRDDDERADAGAADDLRGELVELGGAQQRPGHGTGGDQPFLLDLARVVATGHPIDAHDGERDVVADPGGLLGGEQVLGGGTEELDRRLRRRRRHVAHVDHDVGAGQRLDQPRAGDDVLPCAPGQRDNVVPARPRLVHDEPSDDAGASGHHDPHARCHTRRTIQRPGR